MMSFLVRKILRSSLILWPNVTHIASNNSFDATYFCRRQTGHRWIDGLHTTIGEML